MSPQRAGLYAVGALIVAGAVSVGLPLGAQTAAYDVLIRGGHIIDGTGNPWVAADVAIQRGRIAAVGRLPQATAARVVDARGLRSCAAMRTPPTRASR